MAVGRESLMAAGLGLARLKLWSTASFLFGGRSALFYSITARRSTHPEEFKADMVTLFQLLRAGAIQPVVIERLPLAAASESMPASTGVDWAARLCCCPGLRSAPSVDGAKGARKKIPKHDDWRTDGTYKLTASDK